MGWKTLTPLAPVVSPKERGDTFLRHSRAGVPPQKWDPGTRDVASRASIFAHEIPRGSDETTGGVRRTAQGAAAGSRKVWT